MNPVPASVLRWRRCSDAGALCDGRSQRDQTPAVASRCSSPFVIRADGANNDDARRIIDQTIKKFGQVEVLVNNAGMTMENGGLLGNDMMKAYDTIMNINNRSVVQLTNLAAAYLISTKRNNVNISSIAGMMAPNDPTWTNYYVSKAVLNHITVYAATELSPRGVRVNVITPGTVKTDFVKNSKYDYTWEDISQ